MTKTARVLVPWDSQDEKTLGLALAYAEQIAVAAGVSDVILLTHTKRQLDVQGCRTSSAPRHRGL